MTERRRTIATAAAVVLGVLGTTVASVAVMSQRHPPRPAPASESLPPPTTGPETTVPLALPPSDPVTIDIPAIGVHSEVQYLGLAPDGTLEVPAPGPLYNQAAWYKYSPTPGALGPAIVTGHVDSVEDGPSVFFRITRADGLVAIFEVDGVRVHPKEEFPTELVYGNTDHAALRLLTCGGPFDRASGHYVDNVIVFASLVGSEVA